LAKKKKKNTGKKLKQLWGGKGDRGGKKESGIGGWTCESKA